MRPRWFGVVGPARSGVGGRWQAGLPDGGRRARAVLPRHRGVVPGVVQRADSRPGGSVVGDQLRGITPSSWRRPVRARRCRPSSGRSTGWPAAHRPRRRSSAAGSSTSRRSRRWPSTSSATCGPRWSGSDTPPPGSGCRRPTSRVAVRSGDTPAADRRAFTRTPSDILITTPESLFLMLTSSAREALTGVETVIVDEVHAVAGTKRGAHLALSLERLDQLLAEAGPAGRAVRDGAAGGGGGALPRRRPSGRRRAAAVDQGVGPRGRRPAGRHVRARRG